MASLLGPFVEAVTQAATSALMQMQYQMMVEAEYAISDFQWEWKGPISDDRAIIDTGRLMNSIKYSEQIRKTGNSLQYTLSWDPVDPETGMHYASLVHYGASQYFNNDRYEEPKEYTARPWTFLLIPREQRDTGSVNTDTGPTPESLPTSGWDAALLTFKKEFRTQLSAKMKVVA